MSSTSQHPSSEIVFNFSLSFSIFSSLIETLAGSLVISFKSAIVIIKALSTNIYIYIIVSSYINYYICLLI